jgi:hypothetical protein
MPEGGLDTGPEFCGVPSPTNPFTASELTKFENMPHPDDSEEEEEEGVEEEGCDEEVAATSPPPEWPPLRRSENSAREFRKALLTAEPALALDDDAEAPEPAIPAFWPLGGAPLGGLVLLSARNHNSTTQRYILEM